MTKNKIDYTDPIENMCRYGAMTNAIQNACMKLKKHFTFEEAQYFIAYLNEEGYNLQEK